MSVDLNRAEELTDEVRKEVKNLFDYQPWDEGQKADGAVVRDVLANAYLAILNIVPPCPTRTRALNHLIDARMLANAAITHKGRY